MAIDVTTLFNVKGAATQENIEALKFIHTSRRHLWPPVDFKRSTRSEKVTVLDVCSHILVPLCGEVLLEQRYHSSIPGGPSMPKLQCAYIGMGTVNTWHGTPDVRVRGTEVVCGKVTRESLVVDEDSDESADESHASSEGDTTTVEGKVMFSDANLPQVVGTCVVASFTHKSLHPNQQALVPTLLIDETQFRVTKMCYLFLRAKLWLLKAHCQKVV